MQSGHWEGSPSEGTFAGHHDQTSFFGKLYSVFTNKPSLILEETLHSLQFEEQFEGVLSKT